MQNLTLLILAASLAANLVKNGQVRWLEEKNKRLLITVLNVISESKGVTRIDESTVRLFAVNQPHHKKAIEMLIKEGIATHYVSGPNSIDGRAELRAA